MDLYHDPGHAHLTHLVQERPNLATFLKQAEFEDDLTHLPDSSFAWEARREYPIHTPQHAVVSKLYVEADTRVPTCVKVAVDDALTAYGVPETVYQLVPAQTKLAREEDYLFPDLQAYPITTPEEVRYAEARLLSQLNDLPLEDRPRIFNKLAHAAVQQNVDLRPETQAYGLAAQCDSHKLAEALATRMYLTKTAEVREKFRALGESLVNAPGQVRAFAVRTKLAELLTKLDAEAGLTYGKDISDPLQTVFNTPVKLGATGIALGDATYDLAQLSGIPATMYGDALGPEIVSEIAPGGQVDPGLLQRILPTLPADMLQILRQALSSAGVRPMGG